MNIAETLAKLKYRFDLGSFPIPYTILAVSLVGASDKLAAIIQVPSRVIILVGVPLGIAVVFTIGWLLDRARFPHYFQEESNKRNLMLMQIHNQTNEAKDNKDASNQPRYGLCFVSE